MNGYGRTCRGERMRTAWPMHIAVYLKGPSLVHHSLQHTRKISKSTRRHHARLADDVIFAGLPGVTLAPLRTVMNAAVRFVAHCRVIM